MANPRKVYHLSPAELDAAAQITEEDRAVAQRVAPAPLRPYLNAGPAQ